MVRWTDKQRAFVDAYLSATKDRWNGTAAARAAKYNGSDAVLAGIAWENLRKPHIAEEIKRRLEAQAMTANEVLERLGDQARGSMADFITITRGKRRTVRIDLGKAEDANKLHLVKKISKTDKGWQVELYDAHAALVDIGKHLGLFVDRVALTDPTGQKSYRSADDLTDDELAAIVSANARRSSGGTAAPEDGAPALA